MSCNPLKGHCTLFPDCTWGECCKLHDRRYANKRLTRAQADKLLYRCVRRKEDFFIASIMYVGVRLFGWYFYKKDK